MNVMSWPAFLVITLIIHCHVASCLRNFAVYKSAYQSSTLNYSNFNWTADKAVDGKITGENPDVSKTCSATKHLLGNHTWEVDIGFLIVVKTITVYKRSHYDQISGFKVFIGNTTKPWTTNQELVEVQQINSSHTFRVNDSLARFVSVIRQNREILTICEVIVDGECEKGTFGDACNESCGNCLYGNLSCNSTTGQCIEGCQRGWSGVTCKDGCKIGAYGYGCNETCGMCFSGNNSCSAIDGQCKLGCEGGWKGGTCKLECNRGAYGHGCNETCGMCFGGNSNCSTFDGRCQFGCEAGWRGSTCKQELSMPPTPSDNGIIIGVVVPVVIVIIILVIVLVVLRVRRKRSNLNKEVPSMPNQEKTVFHQVIQEEESSYQPQEIEDTSFSKEGSQSNLIEAKQSSISGSVYQNTEKKTQLLAKSIPVLSFWSHVMKKKANKEEFESEFQEFNQGLTKKHEVALENPSKNRYKSMYPYDFNRVVLKRLWTHDSEYENNSDYINASHIKGFEGCKCYIAAQGPISKTVDDFWWMVWQEGTECIVMLTNLSELGKMKCIQYWPEKDAEQTYGDVKVKILRTESLADHVRRDFQLIVSGKSRKVTQFHYTAWPDKDVPDTAWSLVEFWKTVRKYKSYGKGPMVVHCSAGIGRTGTFIALDIIYDEACETGHIAIMKCVENLREQRVNMVQTANQFIFLHDVVAEALGFGTMSVYKKQLSDVLRHLMEQDEISALTRLQRQYNFLKKDFGQEESNMPVYSKAEGFQSEIIWLPNLSGKNAYIAVKGMDDEALLATIQGRNVKSLIIVDSNSCKGVLFSTGVNQSTTVAGLGITCKKKDDLGFFERNQLSITSDERKEPQKLTMFLLKTWEVSQEVPSDSNSVLPLLEDINLYHPSPSEINPVLLYSRWELNRCSLLYILLNEKDRIRRDGESHILRTSSEMLERSSKLLPTFEQYAFIYKCLATDALPDSTYENTAGIMREIL